MTVYFACKPYLLFVAVVFETVSVLPPYVKKRMQLHPFLYCGASLACLLQNVRETTLHPVDQL